MIHKLHQCHTIFFDLEFYVPEGSRKKSGLNYNPWDESCRLLGGTFLIMDGHQIESMQDDYSKNIKSFWLWNKKAEKDLVTNIFNYLTDIMNKGTKWQRLSLCGIGITSSDVPVLFDLFKRYNLLTNAEAFSMQNKFRVMDISALAAPNVKHNTGFMYPIPKAELIHKYLQRKKMESGKIVWNLFEKGEYSEIVERVNEEVIISHECYVGIVAESRRWRDAKDELRNLKNKLRNNVEVM